MAMTNANLPNGGQTRRCSIQYDDGLSYEQGLQIASELVQFVEQDFTLVESWFQGTRFSWPLPLPVHVVNLDDPSRGATWSVSDFGDPFDQRARHSPAIKINASILADQTRDTMIGPETLPASVLARYLFVAELTEMFMAIQDAGWFVESHGLLGVQYANEGGKGEALSKFLTIQFLVANGFQCRAVDGFGVAEAWLNSSRPDQINFNNADLQDINAVSCIELFLFYLHDVLKFSVMQIINAGSATVADVYRKLTSSNNDPFPQFLALTNSYYPPPRQYHLVRESIFPLSSLADQRFVVGPLRSGYVDSGFVSLDLPPPTDVPIAMHSDNQQMVVVPPVVMVAQRTTAASFQIQTQALPMPFRAIPVALKAGYGGREITVHTEIRPPTLSLMFASNSVRDGNAVKATVALSYASQRGDVVVSVTSSSGYADAPATVTVPEGETSTDFYVSAPANLIGHKTAHAWITLSIRDSSGVSVTNSPFQILTILSAEPFIEVESLTLNPKEISGGGSVVATVKMYEPVAAATTVLVQAFDPAMGPNGPLPGLGWPSSAVILPASVVVPKGASSRSFTIRATASPNPRERRSVRILARHRSVRVVTLSILG